mgnify:CR=1 FL=1|tara:strand:+ start:3586 stop:3867 length:282 start_codon:yes stop_codon:yes gene_type:complete
MRTVDQMVKHFQAMRSHGTMATTSMIREIEQQYINMAQGGDGGQLDGFDYGTTCRNHNYKGYPDSFFRTVCERMGWLPSNESIKLEAYSADPV